MKADLVSIVEAAYDVEQSAEAWLTGILTTAAPAIEAGAGVISYTYDASDPGDFRITAFVQHGVPDGVTDFFRQSFQYIDAAYIRQSYYKLACGTGSEVRGWNNLPFVGSPLDHLGVRDLLHVNGINPDGHGCCVGAFLPRETRIAAPRRATLARIGCHLAAAHRLRRRFESSGVSANTPEAILDARGKVHHAEGEATSKRALSQLQQSAMTITNARGPLRTLAPETAVEEWKGLIAARWTLVDVSELDGRRYLVARQNQTSTRGPSVLTEREQQVVELASLGHHNKLIAYTLGVSHSTVRVLIARAAQKLHARSRPDLVQRYRVASQRER